MSVSAGLEAVRMARHSLPVIDIADLTSPLPARRAAVGEALRAACADKGFFYIVGHGVDAALVDRTVEQAQRFFALPMAEKLTLDLDRSPCGHGYEPLKRQTLEAGAPADLKEGFYFGRDRGSSGRAADDRRFYGANQLPAAAPEFQATLEAYYGEMLLLARRLMGGLALSLGQEEDFFADFCRDPFARLRLLHYPPQPPNASGGKTGAEEKGAGAHTDFGGITILKQDSAGGLQVLDQAADTWIHADPIPDSFVVNLGDMIARWTNDRYRSTLHRVVNLSGRERYSIPFFFHGTLDHVVRCIPSCLGEAGALYPETTVAAHFQRKFKDSYVPG